MKSFLTTLIIFLIFACETDKTTQAEDLNKINKLFKDIQKTANSKNCTFDSEWTFTSIGSKACGGPTAYLAFPFKLRKTDFLDKVREHKIAQEKYNKKWKIISDCSVPRKPRAIKCKGGKASFVY